MSGQLFRKFDLGGFYGLELGILKLLAMINL